MNSIFVICLTDYIYLSASLQNTLICVMWPCLGPSTCKIGLKVKFDPALTVLTVRHAFFSLPLLLAPVKVRKSYLELIPAAGWLAGWKELEEGWLTSLSLKVQPMTRTGQSLLAKDSLLTQTVNQRMPGP